MNNPRPLNGAVDLGACEVELCTGLQIIPDSRFQISNYPNPTGGITHFSFLISQYQYVQLKIYDVNGREVATVADGEMPEGQHVITWNAQNLPAGVYYFRLTTDDCRLTTGTGKLVKYY
jgi:hypothetical protein